MLNITLTNGAFRQWTPEQYSDHMYDGKVFVVIQNSQWVGIYNMDSVRSIEVDV